MFRVLSIIFGVKVVRLLRLLLRLKYVYMVEEFRVDFILLIIRIYLRLLLSSSQHGKFFFLPVMIKIRRKIYTINCIIYSILLIIRVILITVYSRLSFRGNFKKFFKFFPASRDTWKKNLHKLHYLSCSINYSHKHYE